MSDLFYFSCEALCFRFWVYPIFLFGDYYPSYYCYLSTSLPLYGDAYWLWYLSTYVLLKFL